jgi:hypothetical protein
MILERDAATEMVDHMFQHFQGRVTAGTNDDSTTQPVVETIRNLRMTLKIQLLPTPHQPLSVIAKKTPFIANKFEI